MTKDRNLFKPIPKNQPHNKPEDQNKPKNIFHNPKNDLQNPKHDLQNPKHDLQNPKYDIQNLKVDAHLKKARTLKILPPQQPPITLRQLPLTTYRPSPQELTTRKWQHLTKFQHLSSKAHYLFNLKNATLFLSYSLAQKTISLVLEDKLSFDYWAVCCMFMSMKYEEIYPPRLKDLQGIVKMAIDLKAYWDAELTIWDFIGADMNFESLNTRLSEFMHVLTKEQRFFIFYLLEIALYKRKQLKRFSEKEIVLSVMYIFASQKFTLEANETIDGSVFSVIEQCGKEIIFGQIEAQQSGNLVYKKYKMDIRNCVALKGIPHLEAVTNLLVRKVNQPEKPPKIVGFYPESYKSEMIDEKDEKDDTGN